MKYRQIVTLLLRYLPRDGDFRRQVINAFIHIDALWMLPFIEWLHGRSPSDQATQLAPILLHALSRQQLETFLRVYIVPTSTRDTTLNDEISEAINAILASHEEAT